MHKKARQQFLSRGKLFFSGLHDKAPHRLLAMRRSSYVKSTYHNSHYKRKSGVARSCGLYFFDRNN